MRIVRGAGELGDALGELGRTRRIVAQLVEGLREPVEVVDGGRLVGRRHGRHVGIPMGRDGDDGLGPRQELAERGQKGPRRPILQDQHGRAVRNKDRWHRHRFIPRSPHGSLCAIGVSYQGTGI
ncbi:hypothetical protein NGUA35_03818 [Salmonella enterica]|nr:hypothetical protein NGUA35_03818 [Salmonella enterica]